MGRTTIWTYIKRYKFQSVFLRLLTMVMLLLFIPFGCIGLIVRENSLRSMEEKSALLAQERMQSFAAACDNALKSIDRMLLAIIHMSCVQKFFVVDEAAFNLSEDYLEIMNTISMFRLTDADISSISVYSERNDYVVREGGSGKQQDKDHQFLRRYWACGDFAAFSEMGDAPEKTSITFVRGIRYGMERAGVVAVEFSVQKFFETIGIRQDDLENALALVDADGYILMDSRQEYIGRPVEEFIKEQRGLPLIHLSAAAPKNGWSYSYTLDTSYYGQLHNEMVKFSFWIFVAAFLMSICITVIVSLKMFRPLSELLNTFGELDAANGDKNEMGFIQRTLFQLLARNTALSDEMSEKLGLLKKAQVSALQNQISPHFVYNTLETVKWRVMSLEDGDDTVSSVIGRLSRIFRYSLDMQTYLVEVGDEIAHTQSYIEVLQTRYEDRFDVVWEVEETARRAKALKLSLQPLVENAIQHGILPSGRRGEVRVHIDTADSVLRVVVTDNGMGLSPGRLMEIRKTLEHENRTEVHGIGMRNVNLRIKLFFGEEYGLEVASQERVGTVVTMTAPLVL